MLDMIADKKFGRELSTEQLFAFARAAVDPHTPDYQIAALLMAIRLNGMSPRETADLTLAMARTGDMLQPDVGGIPVDKHSTGGVGDTTTLVLVPLVAACKGKVVKMSGRGLGHTGGTIDKLESIPGFQTELAEEDFLRIARDVGCCVVGQTGELAPADKRLYALRDVTSTVDSIPLIASSIMGKKLAGGAQGIVLDVKLGSGALMKTFADCEALAGAMVDIGRRADRRMHAFITSMDQPLGSHVGNALEVQDAIDVLAGRSKGPLLDLSLALGARMLVLGGVAGDETEALMRLEDAIQSGAGLAKFAEMIAAQGGDARVCQDTSLLPQPEKRVPVLAKSAGFIAAMDSEALGLCAQRLGAGRLTKDDVIDPAAGFILKVRLGDEIKTGQQLALLQGKADAPFGEVASMMEEAITISPSKPEALPLIRAQIAPD